MGNIVDIPGLQARARNASGSIPGAHGVRVAHSCASDARAAVREFHAAVSSPNMAGFSTCGEQFIGIYINKTMTGIVIGYGGAGRGE